MATIIALTACILTCSVFSEVTLLAHSLGTARSVCLIPVDFGRISLRRFHLWVSGGSRAARERRSAGVLVTF